MTGSSTSVREGSLAGSTYVPPPAMSGDAGDRGSLRRRLRILHVLDRLDLGGTEKAVMKLVRGLEPELFENYICALRGTPTTDNAWASGVTVLHPGLEGTGFRFNVPRLVRVMKEVRPTVVHSRNWGGIEATVAARLAGVPVAIHSEHGYELEMSSGLPFHRRLLRHIAYRSSCAVATVTYDLRRYHAAQAWWNPEAINVLYNGVDGEEFRPQPAARDAVRRRLGIPADALVIGSVGRMVPLKDFATLLKAAEALAPEVPLLYVLLVGSGPELSRLQSYAGNSAQLAGRTVFPGTIDHVADMLNAMDIFVLPTLMEGMSNTLLEAMAIGLPVVATRVGGNPEILADGECGFLFTPRNLPELVGQLKMLLQDAQRRSRFGRAARERALRHFSLERMLKCYRDLYINLAIRRGAATASTGYVRN